ncbi:MAG: zinc ribbon domain-containing protein [Anaerolineales bacterium]|nr:zinc ribbon domain-containing protein [Anaerolineales bacterium]
MPVYTYRCEACGIHPNATNFFTDTPLKTPPWECRKKALKKVITPTKIIFKGSGFNATDHKSPFGRHIQRKKLKKPRKLRRRKALPGARRASLQRARVGIK